jgi:hypothetical protein
MLQRLGRGRWPGLGVSVWPRLVESDVAFSPRAQRHVLGIAFSARSRSFWLTRRENDKGLVEHWSADGKHLSTPVTVPAAMFKASGLIHANGTLWVVREQPDSSAWRTSTSPDGTCPRSILESMHPFLGVGDSNSHGATGSERPVAATG